MRITSHHRSLTSSEIEMGRLVFADAIDYARVKVHCCGYWLLCGVQPSHMAVCPNGHMYFPPPVHLPDYAQASVQDQAWFMHELTHVWQHQMGHWLKLNRVLRPFMSYAYSLGDEQTFADFNLEAQARLVEDYFLAVHRQAQGLIRQTAYRQSPTFPADIARVMVDFLRSPADRQHLPRFFA